MKASLVWAVVFGLGAAAGVAAQEAGRGVAVSGGAGLVESPEEGGGRVSASAVLGVTVRIEEALGISAVVPAGVGEAGLAVSAGWLVEGVAPHVVTVLDDRTFEGREGHDTGISPPREVSGGVVRVMVAAAL